MIMTRRLILTLALSVLLIDPLTDRPALALQPSDKAIVIHVANMHCNNCAKRLARKLYTIPGVVAVHADLTKDIALVSPQKAKTPSLRALWDATIAAKLKPVKLVTPKKIFTSQPKT